MTTSRSTSRHRTRVPLLLIGALALPFGAAPASAQGSPACDLGCPPIKLCGLLDEACHEENECQNEQLSCNAKLAIFNGYIAQMALGVPLHSLPALYTEILDPYYSTANVIEWQFGYSNRQPANNATNPCERGFFNDAAFVVKLQNGDLTSGYEDLTSRSDFRWLFHEIQHFEQCMQVGGYDYFAKMWWDHLSQTDLLTMDLKQIHGQMPLEQAAASRAQAILIQVRACCIHPASGKLIRPLEVSPIYTSVGLPLTGNAVELAVTTQDGATPLTIEWSVSNPGVNYFTILPLSSANPANATWTPTLEGDHELRVRIAQATGTFNDFAHVSVTRTVNVGGYDDDPPATVDMGELLRGIESLTLVQRDPDGRITDGGVDCLSCTRDFTMTAIRQVLERGGVQERVTIRLYDASGSLAAELGTYTPLRGSFGDMPEAQRVSPRGEFQDAGSGCGYRLVVTGAGGQMIGETTMCLHRR